MYAIRSYYDNEQPAVKEGARLVNFRCHDVSKSKVAAAFETAAGYNLSVDPTTFTGRMVEKSELNAAHDGRVLERPLRITSYNVCYTKLLRAQQQVGAHRAELEFRHVRMRNNFV